MKGLRTDQGLAAAFRLRAYRLRTGRSSEDIARDLRISRAAVYRYEKGDVIKIETLTGIAALLGLSVPEVMTPPSQAEEREYLSLVLDAAELPDAILARVRTELLGATP